MVLISVIVYPEALVGTDMEPTDRAMLSAAPAATVFGAVAATVAAMVESAVWPAAVDWMS